MCKLDANARVPDARFGRNVAGGVAGLDANAKLLTHQLPYTTTHEWDGRRLRLRNLDGTYGEYVKSASSAIHIA